MIWQSNLKVSVVQTAEKVLIKGGNSGFISLVAISVVVMCCTVNLAITLPDTINIQDVISFPFSAQCQAIDRSWPARLSCPSFSDPKTKCDRRNRNPTIQICQLSHRCRMTADQAVISHRSRDWIPDHAIHTQQDNPMLVANLNQSHSAMM